MKLFFDMEFTGLHQNTTPISLGIVSEDGKTFYAEFIDYDENQIDSWLRCNVIENTHLYRYDAHEFPSATFTGTRQEMAARVESWLCQFEQVEMWSDCLAYDWVLFCELFGGGAECLPRNVLYIPFDICTLFWAKGIDPDIDRCSFSGLGLTKHNALDDALMIKRCYERLTSK